MPSNTSVYHHNSFVLATIVSSLSNLEGEEVFEASSLGSCDYVGQERISDDELIIIKGNITNIIFLVDF